MTQISITYQYLKNGFLSFNISFGLPFAVNTQIAMILTLLKLSFFKYT